MRRVRQAVLTAVLAAGVCAGQAQDAASPTAALEHGVLTVWLVSPATDGYKLRMANLKAQKEIAAAALPATVQQQTAGSFGQSSSNFGQTAGSYGTASSSVGTNASDTGQAAGTYGATAGSFGKSASNHGQAAGSYGTAAGSFGQTSSSYGQSLGGASLAAAGPAPASAPGRDAVHDDLARYLNQYFSELEVHFVGVFAEELQEKLAGAEGSKDYPDLVIGSALPNGWEQSGLGVAMLGLPSFLDARVATGYGVPLQTAKIDILIRAPHPERARAFVVWWRERGTCDGCARILEKAADNPAGVAAGALGDVLRGDGLGERADADAAQFSAEIARQLALVAPSAAATDGLKFKIDVLDARANDRLAVVALRGIASSPQAFGVVHAEVVLRKSDGGRWKVLQISPNVPADPPSRWGLMRTYAHAGDPAKVLGVSQASPPDGDIRPRFTDLWWDDGGGAGLLAVEWQMHYGAWTDSRMLLVSDLNPRSETRVRASFASTPGEYRWRVWSVGTGGVVKLSPWRTLKIVP